MQKSERKPLVLRIKGPATEPSCRPVTPGRAHARDQVGRGAGGVARRCAPPSLFAPCLLTSRLPRCSVEASHHARCLDQIQATAQGIFDLAQAQAGQRGEGHGAQSEAGEAEELRRGQEGRQAEGEAAMGLRDVAQRAVRRPHASRSPALQVAGRAPGGLHPRVRS